MKRKTIRPDADRHDAASRKRRDAKKWRLLQAARLLDEFRRTVKGGGYERGRLVPDCEAGH